MSLLLSRMLPRSGRTANYHILLAIDRIAVSSAMQLLQSLAATVSNHVFVTVMDIATHAEDRLTVESQAEIASALCLRRTEGVDAEFQGPSPITLRFAVLSATSRQACDALCVGCWETRYSWHKLFALRDFCRESTSTGSMTCFLYLDASCIVRCALMQGCGVHGCSSLVVFAGRTFLLLSGRVSVMQWSPLWLMTSCLQGVRQRFQPKRC